MTRGRLRTLLLGPADPAGGITVQSALTKMLIFVIPMVVLLANGVLWAALLVLPSILFATFALRAARAGNYGSLGNRR